MEESDAVNTPLCSRWTLANPWLWLGPGTGLAMTVATIARGGMEPGPGLVALAVVGLLTTGIGLAVRLNSDHSPFAPRWMHFLLIVALILFLAGSSALQSWIFAAALWGVDPFQSDGLAIGHPPPFYPGLMGIVWALIVPMSVYALMKLVRHGFKAGGFSKETETAALLLFTTANCLLVGYALGADTLRLFLSVTAFLASIDGVCAVAASGPASRLQCRRDTPLCRHFHGHDGAAAVSLVGESVVVASRPPLS